MTGVDKVLERRKRVKGSFTFGVFLSLLLHSGIATVIILAPRWVPPRKEERYINVELVTLPQTYKPVRRKEPVKKKEEETAPEPAKKEEEKQEIVIPKKKEEKPKEIKKPVKKEQEARKKVVMKPPSTGKQRKAEPARTISGGFRGGDITSLNIHDVRFMWYQTIVTSILRSNWATAIAGEEVRGKRVMVIFTIKKNGEIVNVRLLKKSGVFTLDQAVVRAVLNSSPLPSIPEEFKKDELIAEYEFVY
jgi:protein TonB